MDDTQQPGWRRNTCLIARTPADGRAADGQRGSYAVERTLRHRAGADADHPAPVFAARGQNPADADALGEPRLARAALRVCARAGDRPDPGARQRPQHHARSYRRAAAPGGDERSGTRDPSRVRLGRRSPRPVECRLGCTRDRCGGEHHAGGDRRRRPLRPGPTPCAASMPRSRGPTGVRWWTSTVCSNCSGHGSSANAAVSTCSGARSTLR